MITQQSGLGIENNDSNSQLGKIVQDVTALVGKVNTTNQDASAVSLTSTNIKALSNTVRAEILPAKTGVYYEGVIIFEYTHVTTAYTYGKLLKLYIGSTVVQAVPVTLITTLGDKITAVYLLNTGGLIAGIGENVSLGTDDPSSPTLGDGTIKIKSFVREIVKG
jgi:hypothetical protein